MRRIALITLAVALLCASATPAEARRSVGSGTSGYESINAGGVTHALTSSAFARAFIGTTLSGTSTSPA